MKNSIFALTMSTFIFGAFAMSCNTPAEKVENAKTTVVEANKDLAVANQEYLAEMKTYREETSAKIAANDKSVAEFKVRIANQKKAAKADYEKQIADLEQKNTDMKKELDSYKVDSKENWEAFKTKFSKDMDNLGKAFKGFVVKDK